MPRAFAVVVLAVLAGCAAPRTASGVMPVINVRPGVAERIALMDRYRLHDDERKLMMARPRVWVEEVPEEEAAEAPATDENPPAEPAATETASASADAQR